MRAFAEWFRVAAGHEPDACLVRVAEGGLPDSLEVPDAAVKPEMILAWLWRYQYQHLRKSDNSKRREARRLIYVLPQGAIVEPVAGLVRNWLARLGIAGEVGLHLSMGCWAASEGPDWREDMHQPAIVIGTAEYLASKALMRAFGSWSTLWPIDFALVTNGAQWIVHEERLSRQAVATLRSVEEAAKQWGPAEPFGLTVLSCVSERVRMVPRLRGVERGALVAGLGELLVASPSTATWPLAPAALGSRKFLELFDTEGGMCEEAGSFCLPDGGTDPDVGLAWATWTPGEDGAPDPKVRFPAAEWRCAVPLSQAGELARDRVIWRRDHDGQWVRVTGTAEIRPFAVLLVAACDGGYDPVTGFDLSARGPIADCPVLRTPDEQALFTAEPAEAVVPKRWKTLDVHSEEVRDQAAALLAVLYPVVPPVAAASAVVAGYLHDAGKAHETWQNALCALAPDDDQDFVQAGRPWAKSGHGAAGPLEFASDVDFRHELASLLLIDSPLRPLLDAAPDPDLCRYLVLAHHGRLRMRVLEEEEAAGELFGLAQGAVSDVPAILGQPESVLTVDLTEFGHASDESSWSRVARGLLERYGPFVLAYLETVVRIADWRSSGGRELPS
jgi:CRISPR-associated endonuclease/helicase Cas3